MIRWAYTSLLYLAAPVLLGYLHLRGRRQPGYRKQLAERFGLRVPQVPAKGLWIHAASVGEVQAMSGVVRACQTRYTGLPLIISTTTPTGAEQVQRLFGEAVYRVVLPLDFPHAMTRLSGRFSPEWPSSRRWSFGPICLLRFDVKEHRRFWPTRDYRHGARGDIGGRRV